MLRLCSQAPGPLRTLTCSPSRPPAPQGANKEKKQPTHRAHSPLALLSREDTEVVPRTEKSLTPLDHFPVLVKFPAQQLDCCYEKAAVEGSSVPCLLWHICVSFYASKCFESQRKSNKYKNKLIEDLGNPVTSELPERILPAQHHSSTQPCLQSVAMQ